MTVGSLFDALDGGIARLTGKASKAGAALDSSLDRVSESALFIAFLAGRAGSEHVTILYAAPLAMAGSFMVSYVRARAEGLGIECGVGVFTRTERLIALITALFVAGWVGSTAIVVGCLLVAVGAWITAFQRLVRVLRAGSGLPL
jgi:CDP-diacylglycerol--glycerol-3-phosphate 3-phosphatidyltransferase